ncbi:MAG TPA: glycosyltransferase [Actinomycetota bacterium]|nr:glycosyltransferase [Actinomycetota bacterium]
MQAPARVLDVELSEPLPTLDPGAPGDTAARSALVLVRLHGVPLGTLEIDLAQGPVPPAALAEAAWAELRGPLLGHLAHDGLDPVESLGTRGLVTGTAGGTRPPCQRHPDAEFPFASVVISTHERPGPVCECVASVLAADYPSLEVIVVDNAPSSSATRDAIAERFGNDPRVAYVVETTPGASAGRNRGLREATGGVVAFLDDDVVVDRLWLRSLVLGFQAAPGVACVTGMILPAELETPAQIWIEEFGGFDKGYEQQVFDLGEYAPDDPLYPYSVGRFGSGASAAFDPAILRALGGFDTSLGPATPAKGGEDLDAFLRIVLAGHRLVYEPRSLVRHRHRREYDDLRRTVRGYGIGLASVLTKTMATSGHRLDMLRRIPRGALYFLNPGSAKNDKKTSTFPRQLTLTEMGGVLLGPWCYLRSRVRTRRTQRSRG